MRDIAFRGIAEETGLFVYGSLIKSKTFRDMSIDCWIEPSSLHMLGATSTPTLLFFKIDSDTVGQFTGLRDNNNVMMWEGDVCRYKNGDEYSTAEIKYSNGRFTLTTKNGSHDLSAYYLDIEVIGHVHENPGTIRTIK